MFAASKTDSVSGGPPDGQFNYVTMLLHGDGTNGAQNNTFLDSSTNNFTITRNGNTTQGSFSPYGSNWSNFFDGGTSTGLQTPTSTNLNLTGDFTIECWFNFTSTAGVYSAMWTCGSGTYGTESSISYNYPVANEFNFNVQGTGILSSGAISLNTWYHIAVTRSGSTTRMFLNGAIVGTSTTSYTMTDATSNSNTIGNRVPSAPSANYPFNGYISNFRIVKGTAVYTSAFTPSTTFLTAISGTSLLTCADNRFIDDSTNAFAITVNGTPSVQRFNPFGTSTAYSTAVIGGSGYFDGSGDYLTASATNIANFGTGDFIVSAWFNSSTTTGNRKIFDNYNGNNDPNPTLLLNIGGAGKVSWYAGQTAVINSSSTFAANTWNYVVVSRVSSTTKMFLNGTEVGSVSDTRTYAAGYTTVGIGGEPSSSGGSPFLGYITDLQVVKGSGVTSSTVPTAPVSASGTTLALSFTNGAIIDNAMMNNLETVGNAQISTSVKKYGTGSLAFDGTGDCLKSNTASTDLYAFGSGNFTIEMWFYITAFTNTYNTLFDSRPVSTQGAYPTIAITSGRLYYYVSSAERIATANSTITTGQWYHLAVSRSGTSTKMFLDGTQVGSTYTDSTVYVNGTSRPVIGAEGFNSPPNDVINGYIDDLRITKGYARYTATFTPPTSALSDTGPY